MIFMFFNDLLPNIVMSRNTYYPILNIYDHDQIHIKF